MNESFRKDILKHVPHGEEGQLELEWEDAITISKILLKNGYAVCLTGGEMGDEVKLSWLFAGSYENLDWADYGQVCFAHTDYIESYPDAFIKEYGTEEETEEETEDLPGKPEVSE